MAVDDYIRGMTGHEVFSHHIAAHKVIPGREASLGELNPPLPGALDAAVKGMGVERLYSHQVAAIEAIRRGEHTVVATPTASGKSLIYNLPVMEAVLETPDTHALYLFPLKALAQDQLRGLERLTSAVFAADPVTAAIYDGDTPPHARKKIRTRPPHVLMTNPEMLHLSILPYHASWATFLRGLRFVVVDEVHTLKGVMGSHMAWVFRRLKRICRYYGSDPCFVFSSATIGNPAEHASSLADVEVSAITQSGSPASTKHFILLNTPEGASQAAIKLIHSAMHRELRTIVYCQSRKMTELIAMWAASKKADFGEKITAYRSGFLPEERRDIERKMAEGELLTVVSTSALELGIDIGGLDLCILVGYPGSIMATWQRAGRVGRSGRDSLVVLIAQEDALDQYMMTHPDLFFSMDPEKAVVNPANEVLMAKHLDCAAAELPLRRGEPLCRQEAVADKLARMEAFGSLLASADGDLLFSHRKFPQRSVALRGTGDTFDIVDAQSRELIGSVDGHRAVRETYPGAVYIHRGDSYVVTELDLDKRTAVAQKQRVHYFTRIRSHKATEILEVSHRKPLGNAWVGVGKLKVTETITGYEKRLVKGQRLLTVIPLDLPPQVFETEGLWLEVPEAVRVEMEKEQRHFMGGIHAVEHAAIGILPLFAMADRNDIGGISIPHHPQLGKGAVFIYDGFPGGIGICSGVFGQAEALFDRTLSVIRDCPCETGCPACVHSPKCGSGNRPIDKEASRVLLEKLKTPLAPALLSGEPVPRFPAPKPEDASGKPPIPKRYAVLDVETRRSAEEVGGWGRARFMGVSVAVLYDSKTDAFTAWTEDQIPEMARLLKKMDLVVGFNIRRFDYDVLSGVCGADFHRLPTLDMLDEVHKRLGYRLSLDHLSSHTLGAEKSADGLAALAWWKEGRLDLIESYCQKDVALTRDLYLYGRDKGYLLFQNKARTLVRLPVVW
ncbi:DEAD/DEAH box helicase [Desulfoluna butyratoxydans]|uniref:Dead/deah-box helicase putative n=1 Tax=Desulfoluna butyratoxydans TaxID=231438 RepID=A0A4U8YNE3_9BACT|nr:DEAD/DEAH box helicase [Desulfoluna butyratoxydans]VFQ45625.1 dead/deah-box helicase putative [Desulfoluna butyratoxydans]